MIKIVFLVTLLSLSAKASAFTVNMVANAESGDKAIIVGTTNLTYGIELMIAISQKENKYIYVSHTNDLSAY